MGFLFLSVTLNVNFLIKYSQRNEKDDKKGQGYGTQIAKEIKRNAKMVFKYLRRKPARSQ